MRTGPAARLLAVAMCVLATSALGQVGKAPTAAKATLLLASDVACTVKLDGEKVADLQPDVPAKLQVAPGEYLVSAATPDGQKWSKAIQVNAPKTVVKIEFAGVAVAAPAAPGASAGLTGILLVFADSPVQVEIDGKPAGFVPGTPVEPGQLSLKLTLGKHFVRAVSRDFPEVNAAADVQIREGSQEIVRAMVADQVEIARAEAAEQASKRQAAIRAAETLKVEIETAKAHVKTLDLRWVAIQAGKFQMGCSSGDKECYADEKPTHTVQITKPFEIMATEVTAGQFRTWAISQGYEPPAQPEWSTSSIAVVSVTWNDSQAFCSAFGARLPTEAEWEYAARAGTSSARYGSLEGVAWYDGNSGKRAQPVAGKKPNAFGLYDMLGNVWEWCADWYGEKYYEEKVEADPTGPPSGAYRVPRGGSWGDGPRRVRASWRYGLAPDRRGDFYGFRCLRDPNSPVTLSSSPDLKKLETPQAVASRPRAATSSATRAAPAALVAEDFAVVKRKLEDARRREEEAKRQADVAAQRRAEQARLQAEAEAREMAERMAAEDRADKAEFAQQLGSALGQLGQSIGDYQKVRRGDLTPLGIYPTPAPPPPAAYVPPSASGSSGTRTALAPQPTPTPSGARLVTGYTPPTPTPTPRPVYVAATPTPMPNPKQQLPCYVSQPQYCTIIRLVNRSGVVINNTYVNGDQGGGLLLGGTFDNIHAPLPGGVALDAFSDQTVNPDNPQRVEWHLSLTGPLSSCSGYTVYLDPGGAWQTGATFDKACVR